MPEMVKKINAIRVDEEAHEIEEIISDDQEIKIMVNKTVIGTFSMSPANLKEFVIGYLLGEGLLSSKDDISKLKIEDKLIEVETDLADFDLRRELVMSSDCFGGMRSKIDLTKKVESDHKITKEMVLEASKKLRESSSIWSATGGTHIAALVTEDDFIAIEDVSRHVAIDKVVGAAELRGIDFSNCFMFSSGRMPGDMIIKIARIGIPIIASKSAPTSSGYMVGEEANVTIIGFVRGKRFNIYTHPERVIY
ncbi:formate dehydrogenase accessory sulfurtransferase FdhD [Methanobacterium sp. ACI-7]|uniref:formate dehydrogenase accessory sulfurtransferase FdhD n=1 Tax=unclassified Methanobacterium TaxID=2627676 RepID=UPI0039C01307